MVISMVSVIEHITLEQKVLFLSGLRRDFNCTVTLPLQTWVADRAEIACRRLHSCIPISVKTEEHMIRKSLSAFDLVATQSSGNPIDLVSGCKQLEIVIRYFTLRFSMMVVL